MAFEQMNYKNSVGRSIRNKSREAEKVETGNQAITQMSLRRLNCERHVTNYLKSASSKSEGNSIVTPSRNITYCKFCNIRTMPASNTIGLFPTKRTFTMSLAFLLLLSICWTDADVMEQSDDDDSSAYLHRKLGGREKREVQREILSVLGLTRRPRPAGEPARGLQHDSAPLYMLGLYNTVSGFAEIFQKRIKQGSSGNSDPNFPQKRDSPISESYAHSAHKSLGHSVGPFSDIYPYDVQVATNSAWYRFSEAQRAFSHEVGIPYLTPPSPEPVHYSDIHYTGGNSMENTLERNLLGDADVVMSFIATNRGNNDVDEATRAHLKRHRAYHFLLNQIPDEDTLTAAKFRLYKDVSDEALGNTTLRVNVYQAMYDRDREFMLKLLGSRLVKSSQEGWLVFDVTSACQDWLLNHSNNMGLRVTVETAGGRSVNLNKVGIVGRRGDSSKQAFLVSFLSQGTDSLPSRLRKRLRRNLDDQDMYDDEEEDEEEEDNEIEVEDEFDTRTTEDFDVEPTQEDNRRTRRARTNGRRKSNKRRERQRNRIKYDERNEKDDACHIEELYVNFQDLNWDAWIIAPSGYRAFHCMGVCRFPLNANMNATNHAIVQTLVHLLNPERLPQPCCSPTKLDAISVLYYDDDNNVVYKKYKDMVVRACGCH